MIPTPIYRDHTGWREVNPYPEKILKNTSKDGESKVYQTDYRYTLFEKQVKRFDFPSAPDVELGVVVMAELVHQCKVWSSGEGYHWITQKNVRRREDGSVISIAGMEIESRDIWVLSEQQAKDELPTIEFDSNTLNPDNYDEDGKPFVQHRDPLTPHDTVEEAAEKYVNEINAKYPGIMPFGSNLIFIDGANYQSTKDAKEIKELREVLKAINAIAFATGLSSLSTNYIEPMKEIFELSTDILNK